ncbi:MAG: hypothetical protein ILM98_04065 [Kiritimatiellae bacterium]|nr:hypothetical protein [Kiritimatiellia bacterium]
MSAIPLIIAASMLRFLDPFTSLYQTDDDRAGRALASEPGFWPTANGQKDPLAEKPKARVLYNVFRTSDQPFPDYDPEKPSPLFKVNQVGYAPEQPKFAYLGAWLGPNLGPWRPRWGNGEQGTGNGEQGTGNGEQGTGNGEL